MIVTESDIYFAILRQRINTPDYAKLHGTPGRSEDLVTQDHSHDDIKVQLRAMKELGRVEFKGVPGREENLEFNELFLSSWGEERMAPLADLGQAPTIED
jgi:hypothetical protein